MPRLRSRANLTARSAVPTATTTRPRRGTATQPPPAAVIERSSPEHPRQSIYLTIKASPNKLRKATGGATSKTAVSAENIVSGKRARTSRVVREVESEDEEEEVEEAEAMDVDEEEEEEEEEEDAEGEDDEEDVDAEGEEDDDDVTPAPRIVATNNHGVRKPSISKPQDSVEAKEMVMADDDDDDEELSEPESEEEVEEEEDEEEEEGEDEDAEDEEDEEPMDQNEEEDEDEGMESEDESRDQTPDLSKLTRRQRAMHIEDSDIGLMALSNEAQKKKHLTAEEHAIRRAEMARRRKNLSEKRNEEEKMDTINRLLKKQPPKRGRKAIQEIVPSENEEEPEREKPNPLYVRYIQNASGARMGVPEEWMQAPVGSMFAGDIAKPSNRPYGGRMVEEVS
ncbi:uncharacterized protein EI97DRAFT_301293 [Westerdykella ornata]|uniref:INO80 complex subunit B-like conserved region domain-containing protein n=1 Tax=Westerdykella ornata TaxID=318751 RepID=A0A6A6JPT3_WESOR|nr:uncharacterized protein EI97DRAFT_301293 [Westerdykella ornata]KAF2277686.1 hypothetical protein EI97DRAFT_301293 [Westerdykella ornata]